MGRLFITPREVDFISDLTKEVIKDVIGQKIFYYAISVIKTRVHDVYEEAPEKIFEEPLEVDALVEWSPEDVRTNQFGTEEHYGIEAYVHHRDILDKGVVLTEGDFFSYGPTFFEVTSIRWDKNVYGQIEHKTGVKLIGKQARKSQFVTTILGPTSEADADADAVQDTFVQQRGFDRNRLGETGDKRALKEKGVLESPLTEPKEISSKGDSTGAGSSFYDE